MALIGGAKYGVTGPITSRSTIYIGRGAASILVRSTPRVPGATWSIGEGQMPMALAGRDWCWWFDLTDVGFIGSSSTSNVTVVTAPLWLLMLVFAVAAAPWRRVVRMRHRFGPHLCKKCGYDRRGLAEDAKCPECGIAAAPASK